MADTHIIRITFTEVGFDVGPFDVYYSTDSGATYTLFVPYTNIPSSAFTGSGYYITNFPDDANYVKVVSNGVCSSFIENEIPCYVTTGTTLCYSWPIASFPLFDSIVTSGGKIIVVGNDVFIGPDTLSLNTNMGAAGLFNLDGTLDLSFNIPITASTIGSKISNVGQFSDGKYLVYSDQFTDTNGYVFSGLTRLNSDGTFDFDYNKPLDNEGSTYNNYGFYIQPDDKILFYGRFIQYDTQACKGIIRLNYNGTIDNTFDSSAESIVFGQQNLPDYKDVPGFKKITRQNDGKFVCVGNFTANTITKNILRFNTNGTIDNTFLNGNGFDYSLATNPYEFNNTQFVEIQSDGKIVICGLFDSYSGISVNNIVRLESNGELDSVFNNNILSIADNEWAINTFSLRPSGKILFTKALKNDVLNVGNVTLLRVNSDGTIDNTFNSLILSGIPTVGGLVNRYNNHPSNYILLLGLFFDGTYDFMRLITEDGDPVICI